MAWGRIAAVWLLLALLMVTQGALRERLATPAFGELRAHQLSSLTGSLIVLAVTWALLPWLRAEASQRIQLAIGAIWLVATVAFEFGFGHFVAGHSWARLLHDYDIAAGRLWSLVLFATLLAPWLGGRLRARVRQRGGVPRSARTC